jgi:hypothetical protein
MLFRWLDCMAVPRKVAGLCFLLILGPWFQGCVGVNTFPTIARSGDTVSVMIGGSEQARKETTDVFLEDVSGSVSYDLKALGLVRSVFNLRADGRAAGAHYSPYLDTFISWSEGHEPLQTVLVTDLPDSLLPGLYTLTVETNVTDDASGAARPFSINLEIIDGVGSSDQFLRQPLLSAVEFERLEPAPHAKIDFGTGPDVIGAVSLVVDFDEAIVNPDDINVYVPESTVRGFFGNPGAFGETQRMVYWRQDGQRLLIDVIAPQGIEPRFLMLYVVHPPGVPGSPNFQLTNATGYDLNGNTMAVAPTLQYFP